FPTGSGSFMNLNQIAGILSGKIADIFLKNEDGERKLHGKYNWFYKRPENQNLILFFEYFHGDLSYGLGASHQTGWTALITDLLRYQNVEF
ncbi:MAG TPA: glucosidase, partial [Flavisolibacter sp.]|nr:glucosidase [Flavisolibacter sp.]